MEPRGHDDLIERCLASIRAISPGLAVHFGEPSPRRQAGAQADGELRVAMGRPRGEQRYLVQTKRTHLSYGVVDALLGRLRNDPGRWVLFAPHVAPPMGRHLAEHQVSYVDAVGNLHLQANGGGILAHVEGKVARRAPAARGMRQPAHLVNFTLLARPALVTEPIRSIAQAAGVSKSAVADQLGRLSEQGFLVKTRQGPSLLRTGELLDRWVSAWLDVIRPRWLIGRFHPQATDVVAVESQLEKGLSDLTWALGGGAAAWRMTRFHRGEETVVFLATVPQDLPARLRALPSEAGTLVVLRATAPAALEGIAPHLTHPLLVYSELLASQDPRTREAAEGIRSRFLSELE